MEPLAARFLHWQATTMLESETQLIERMKAGDREALGQWLNVRRGPLLAFIERRLGTALRRKVDPDDLWQEVNTEAVRCFGEMDLSQRDPFGWLCQIAERRIIDAHRRFFGSQKRDAGREVPLSAGSSDDSRAGLIDLLVASMTTASQAFSRDQRQIRLLARSKNCRKSSAMLCECATSKTCRQRRSPRNWARPTARSA